MVLSATTYPLPFTASLSGLADKLAHLPGFVYLDSGDREFSAEMEIVAALPTVTHRLEDYSGNLGDWMTAVERDVREGHDHHDILGRSGAFTGRVAIGSLDYNAPAGRLIGQVDEPSRTMAAIYHWLLVSHRPSATTELLFHADCPEDTRTAVLAALESDKPAKSSAFAITQPFKAAISKRDYQQSVEQIQAYILAGDCYQVNFAQRFESMLEGDAWTAYRAIRDNLAGGFSGFMRPSDNHAILSLSPERFLSIRDGVVTTQPIKGTAPRHSDPEQDRRLAEALERSEKDRAENVMITDLLRNDIGQFCEPGSVEVTELCGLHSFGNVHHLISTVQGRLATGTTAGQLLLATSPGGSITGAPKKRAVEIIAELEDLPRGAYCGSLFMLGGGDWLQSSIAIRTLEAHNGNLYCWGGGGITASSHWQAEYQETLDKVGPIMRALEAASQCSGNSMPS
jgi:para-aminobenzoate synthetase component 1